MHNSCRISEAPDRYGISDIPPDAYCGMAERHSADWKPWIPLPAGQSPECYVSAAAFEYP